MPTCRNVIAPTWQSVSNFYDRFDKERIYSVERIKKGADDSEADGISPRVNVQPVEQKR